MRAAAADSPSPLPAGILETAPFPHNIPRPGNEADFKQIYDRYSRRVYLLCLRMVRNPTEAEDLTQDALLRVFRKMHTFRGESNFSTWLHKLVVNVVLMRLRKQSRSPRFCEEEIPSDEQPGNAGKEWGAPDLMLQGTIDRVSLERAIVQLAPGFRTVLVMHDVQGFQHDEIAEIVGISIGASKSQLHKARLRLRALLCASESDTALARRPAIARGHSRPPLCEVECLAVR